MSEKIKIIDEELIQRQLEAGRGKSREEILEVVAKAEKARGIEPEEAAALLQTEDPELIEEIFQAARRVKLKIYGKRLVLFAPLYLSNYCVNNCRYCGFRRENPHISRKRLTPEEIREQVKEWRIWGTSAFCWNVGNLPFRISVSWKRPSPPFTPPRMETEKSGA